MKWKCVTESQVAVTGPLAPWLRLPTRLSLVSSVCHGYMSLSRFPVAPRAGRPVYLEESRVVPEERQGCF